MVHTVVRRRYQDPVYGLCLRWLGDAELATEAVRVSLLDFAERLSRTTVPPGVLVYQRAIAACEARADARASHNTVLAEGDESRLQSMLAELDSAELSVLLLRDLVGLDSDQIAEVLALSRGSVRARLQRARLRFGRLLDPQLDV